MNNFCLILFVVTLIVPRLAVGQTSTGPANQTTTLKIAIPLRTGFREFVNSNTNNITGEERFGGFAVEVFRATAERAFPNGLDFKFIPFTTGTFDDMLKEVASQKFDGAAGDILIVNYRTDWVNFTLPYMDTGISMLVPLEKTKAGRISLIKVTKGFVAATLAVGFLVALVFWILEYRNDKHASQQQIMNSRSQNDADWRREILGSIIQTRLVMVLLFMMLLVLMACYSASQTSSLTRQRRNGTVKSLNQLIANGANVGFQKGSFIRGMLIQSNFLESQLKAFDSPEEMYAMLLKGPKQGGIAAVVGLTPHLRIRQRQHCDALTLVPTFNLHAAGFGFAFPRESSLVHYFSKGILDVMYTDGQLAKIQDWTIGDLEVCKDDDRNDQLLDSDTLSILVAGAIGVLLFITIIMLVHGGITCNRTRNKKGVAYPCYLLPRCC